MGTTGSKHHPTLRAKAQHSDRGTKSVEPNKATAEPKASSVPPNDTPDTESPTSTASKEPMFEGGTAASPRNAASNGQASSSYQPIRDEDVKVNLAMADLMAYLQVIATNSQNLPLTRRDDPEVGKSVSCLSAEEYAKKSAAFIPTDVRVIGGAFTKYGRVWDLPTSEEFNAVDNAQEPGRSFGGACCNAMLKVLYDAANEAADADNMAANAEALFDDDDDDESLMSRSAFQRARTFESLVLGKNCTTSRITWLDLLRKMKAEIDDIEYAQVPVVTSTRKIDLTSPFSLVPENFNSETGKMRSLLVGCNYTNVHGAELMASHDDIRSMKDYIVNVHGFPESNELMTVLLDDDEHEHPTHENITAALMALSERSQPGDAVFIQFSGHGGRVLDAPIDSDAQSYDEAIAPSDYATNGLIRDTLIFKTLLAPMRYGVTLTILIDCADTGMILELPYSWSTKKDRPLSTPKMSTNNEFSFVRFLKVVKTLYDTSIFTQLGNTVDLVLNDQRDDFEEPETEDDTVKNDATMDSIPEDSVRNSLLDALTACTSPSNADCVEIKVQSNNSFRPTDALTRARQKPESSLLDQVINSCGVGPDDDILSDDDTYRIDGLDSRTFDSLTDDSTLASYKKKARRQGLV